MDKNAAREEPRGIVPVIDVHRRLRIAREIFDASITQDNFGALIGASGNTVGNYETGATTRLKDVYIRNWANVTGVDYWWLKTGNAPQPEGPTEGRGTGSKTPESGTPLYHLPRVVHVDFAASKKVAA